MIPQVFLDANIVVRFGTSPHGLEYSRLVALIEAGEVTLVTTDLTAMEIAKRHTKNEYPVVKEIGTSKYRDAVKRVFNVALPETTKSEIYKRVFQINLAKVKNMFHSLSATVLSIDDVNPIDVFKDYAQQDGFFSESGKKDQFPDAFIFASLMKCLENNIPLIVVSDDGDLNKPCESYEHVTKVDSLPGLFAELGYEIDKLDVDEYLDENMKELAQLLYLELRHWELYGEDVLDSEVYVKGVEVLKILRIANFKPVNMGEPVLVSATFEVEASVDFNHPDWDTAMYDSEDKVAIPLHDVSGQTDVTIEVDVSILISRDENDEFDKIEDLQLSNDNFLSVTLFPDEYY